MAKPAIRLMIIDDKPEHRLAAQRMAEQVAPVHLLYAGDDYDQASTSLLQDVPDLLILEIGIRNGNGMEFIRKMRLRHPELKMLVYTYQDENLYAERALRVGAHGYLMKPSDFLHFLQAYKAVLHGELFVSPEIEEKILRHIAGQNDADERDPEQVLSNRELEIFVKIGSGLSSRDIATQLGLSIKTVETHRAHIKRKLNILAARELMQVAEDWVDRTHTHGV